MGRRHKLLQKILGGHSDANIRFNELRRLLKKLGFVERVPGSHHVFVRGDIAERLARA